MVTGRLLATKEEIKMNDEQVSNPNLFVEQYFKKYPLGQLLPAPGGAAVAPAYTQFYTFNGVLTFIRGLLEGSKFAVSGSKMDLCLTS